MILQEQGHNITSENILFAWLEESGYVFRTRNNGVTTWFEVSLDKQFDYKVKIGFEGSKVEVYSFEKGTGWGITICKLNLCKSYSLDALGKALRHWLWEMR